MNAFDSVIIENQICLPSAMSSSPSKSSASSSSAFTSSSPVQLKMFVNKNKTSRMQPIDRKTTYLLVYLHLQVSCLAVHRTILEDGLQNCHSEMSFKIVHRLIGIALKVEISSQHINQNGMFSSSLVRYVSQKKNESFTFLATTELIFLFGPVLLEAFFVVVYNALLNPTKNGKTNWILGC